MLPANARLRRRTDFRDALRRGRRAGGPVLVVHLAPPPPGIDHEGPAQVGFAVGRAVGPAVVRNRVRRRLRHLVRHRLSALPPGARVVVRALPAAAQADQQQLGVEFDRALHRAARAGGRGRVGTAAG